MKTFLRAGMPLLVAFFALISVNAMAQTIEQRALITKKNNQSKLRNLRDLISERSSQEKSRALQLATRNGWPVRYKLSNGAGEAELMKIGPNNRPIYFQTFNVDAAVSTRTDHLHTGGSLGLNLDGQGMTAYVWDGGATRTTHQEYDGPGGTNRVTQSDGATTLSSHATHVTGTILGGGIQARAKGMAPHAKGMTNDWNNDLSEMAAAAAAGMLISNHSYGFGWRDRFGNVQLPAYYGGGYITESRDVDEIMYNAPYYLMVSSAGNDGDDNTANTAPLGGNSRFDKLTAYSTAKNNLVVAASEDVSTNPDGTINGVRITGFSSEGPTDDFRIKPDITGNGAGVYSSTSNNNSSYSSFSGTSMSGPNVAGSLLLLQQHYDNVNGSFMKSATLKGLALHTADDAGIPGPDAVFGWGLLNAKAAAETISNNGVSAIIDERTLSQGGSYQITVDAAGGPLLASISWTDPNGSFINTGTNNLSTAVLVNDLDIRITKGGSTFFPYALTGVNTNAKQDNLVDPYERVDIANASGTYTITITHKGSLSNVSQDFSLIITGAVVGTPCALAAPSNLSASDITDNTFDLSWSSVTGAADYTVTINGNPTTVSGTSYTATGLVAGTDYACSVVANCTTGGSGAASDITVTTTGTVSISCSSTVSSYPYGEGFESGDGWTQASGDDGDWFRDSGGTPSNNTGPSAADEGTFYLFLEASTNGSSGQIGNNATAILESPCFDLSGETTATFSFKNHMYGTDVGSLVVQATDDDVTWTDLWSLSGNQGNQWNSVNVDLSSYVGSIVKLRIVGTTGDGWSSDIAIDDLSLTTGPASPNNCDPLSFTGVSLIGHSNSDDGNYTIANDNTVLLEDNTWRSFPIDYTVTANTVVEFEFQSTDQGEIHGIAFASNTSSSSDRTFKIHGTQNWGITDFDNYSGSGWVSYTIPVGDFYTGTFDRLVFSNDNDAGSGNNSYFRNVVIHEGDCSSAAISFARLGEEVDSQTSYYPVPTSETLNIVGDFKGEVTYSVISMVGRKVLEGVFVGNHGKIDVAQLPNGPYMLKSITSEGNNSVIKFIKE